MATQAIERKDPQDGMKFSRNRLSFQAIDPVRLPDYPGSAWRGALGHALLRQTCLTSQHDCPVCAVRRDCDYATLFEPTLPPSADPDARRRYRDPPRPYVLHIPWSHAGNIPPGGGYSLEFTLFGEAVDRCPDFIQALAEAAAGGIGAGQGRLSLKRVQPLPIPNCPAPPTADHILTLLTPLRLKHRGRLVRPQDLNLVPIAQALLRRVPWLMPTLTFDPGTALDEAGRCPISPHDLRWKDWQRYSSRQKNYQKHGGVLGQLRLPAPAAHIPHLWPLLWWGQYTHAGKGAVMGLGAYRVRLDCGAGHQFI